MPIKTGATPGTYSKSQFWNTVIASKGGATLGGHSVSQKSQANVNSGATKTGAMVGIYAPALAILMGADDF
jgi:hypothetical protein